MPRYKVVLEAQGPLVLGDKLPDGNVIASNQYIAGSVVRGALAKAILMPRGLWQSAQSDQPPPDWPAQFQALFEAEPPAYFGFLYPSRQAQAEAGQVETFPLPLTAYSCKAYKGFTTQGDHGVVDRLAAGLSRIIRPAGQSPAVCPHPGCGERLDRLRGFGACPAANPAQTYRVRLNPRTFVKVGLNRRTETAEEGILYTLEALVPGPNPPPPDSPATLEPPLSFVGYWRMSAAQWQALQDILAESIPSREQGYRLRIGSARARGMGQVLLTLPEKPEPEPDLEARLDQFQPADSAGQRLDPDYLYWSLSLRAPLLMYDKFGRPADLADLADTLAAYADRPAGLEFLPQASVVERETWGGWSPVWSLPKPIEPALSAGSVLTFRVPQAGRAGLIPFLKTLQETGLGERRAEGWGEVSICDPFHIHFGKETPYEQ